MIKTLLISEQFPTVKAISIHLKYEDPDFSNSQDELNIYLTNDKKAFFDYRCPHGECVNDDFDLSSTISALVKNSGSEVNGAVSCQAWQVREHFDKHRCLLKMNYTINIEYLTNA